MEPRKQAKVASLLSLWPFVLFASFLGYIYLLATVAAVSGASSAGTVFEAFLFFILQGVTHPAVAAPLVSSSLGVIMGYWFMTRREDRETTKTATRAVIFGFASLAVYAYLLLAASGIGR